MSIPVFSITFEIGSSFLCGKQPNQTKSKDWEPREGNRKTTKRECEKNQRGVCLFMSGLWKWHGCHKNRASSNFHEAIPRVV